MYTYFETMFKCKDSVQTSGRMSKCLNTLELSSLGMAAILGAGTYVVAGQVAATIAGPSVVLSFIIAAITSFLSGLSYAELGARVPNTAGGAYSYSYIAVGEVWAFFIGWNLILEYMIGTAADASALSASFEHIANGLSLNTTSIFYPIEPIYGDTRPDMISFALTIGMTTLLAVGVKDSVRFGSVCNLFNILVIFFIIIIGSFYVDFSRWSSFEKFFPYGINGMLSGSAACFYAFVGFDIIATTGEEARDPTYSIPRAIVITLSIVLICYIGVSSVATLIADHDTLGSRAPIALAFSNIGLRWPSHIISVGAVFGLAASLLGSMFPLPRIIYSMSCDGLLWPCFNYIFKANGIPIIATIVPGLLTALLSFLFELRELVEMMSIGTLLAYILVSLCILILRYKPASMQQSTSASSFPTDTSSDKLIDEPKNDSPKCSELLLTLMCIKVNQEPCKETYICAMFCSFIVIITSFLTSIISLHCLQIGSVSTKFIISLSTITLLGGYCIVVLQRQPQNKKIEGFMVPFVPMLPITAISSNLFLMLKLSKTTWVRFIIWMIAGTVTYFGYSIRKSKLKKS